MEDINIYWYYDSKHGAEDDLVGEIYANDYDLRSKIAPASTSAPSTLASPKKSSHAHKATSSSTIASKKVSLGKEIATPEDVNLYYNIVDNMKKTKFDIYMFEISKLVLQQKLHMKTWKLKKVKKSNANDNGKETINIVKAYTSSSKSKSPSSLTVDFNKLPPYLNNDIIGKRYKSMTPPLILTFEIFNTKYTIV